MSYNDRQSLNQTIPRHISKQELSPTLRNRIQDEYDHIYNHTIHVTEEERYRWNQSAKRVIKPATSHNEGLMTKTDKAKLDGIAANANKYVHPFSNVAPGSYLEVSTDIQGHVIFGNNPTRLNVRARNANKLGSINPDDFISADNAFLKGNVTFKYYNNDSSRANYPITRKNLVQESITHAYYISDDLTPNLNMIRISPTTGVASYYDGDLNTWVNITLEDSIAKLDSNNKVPVPLLPSANIPIGAILPSITANVDMMRADGFLPLKGDTVNKNDYLDLYNFAKDSNLLVPYSNYGKFSNLLSIGHFFDKGDGTFILPKLNDFLGSTSDVRDTGRFTPSCTPRQTSTFNTCTQTDLYRTLDINNRTMVNERLGYYSGAFRLLDRTGAATGLLQNERLSTGRTSTIVIGSFNTNEGIDNESTVNEPWHFNTIYMIKAKY